MRLIIVTVDDLISLCSTDFEFSRVVTSRLHDYCVSNKLRSNRIVNEIANENDICIAILTIHVTSSRDNLFTKASSVMSNNVHCHRGDTLDPF